MFTRDEKPTPDDVRASQAVKDALQDFDRSLSPSEKKDRLIEAYHELSTLGIPFKEAFRQQAVTRYQALVVGKLAAKFTENGLSLEEIASRPDPQV